MQTVVLDAQDSDRGRRGWWNPDLWAPALLVFLGILFFADPLFSSKNFFFRDISSFHYPLRRILIESYARGEFPLWNPFINLGQPMLANPNYMAFYPTNLLHLFLPFNYAYKLHFILHPLIAGLGAYFLQRRLGIGSLGALGGSLVYQFSGTLLSFLNLYNIVPAVALLPWIGWAFLGSLRGKRPRGALLFGALLALQIISFEPLMFQCSLLLLAGLAILHVLESRERLTAAGDVLRSGLVGAVFGAGLAAIQVLPALELLPLSARGSGGGLEFGMVATWSLHPMDLINTFVPDLFGNPYTIGWTTFWGESFHHEREGYLVSFFVGASSLFLALVSFTSPRRRLQSIFAALTLAGAGLALGRFTPAYQWLYEHVPVFRLGRYPSKYFLLSTLTLSILVALGIEAAGIPRNGGERGWRPLAALAVAGLLLAGVILGCWAFWQSQPVLVEGWIRSRVPEHLNAGKEYQVIVPQLLRSIRSSGVFLLLCSALVLAARVRRPALPASALLLPLLAGELMPANLRLTPLISDAGVDFEPEVYSRIHDNRPDEPFRVFSPAMIRPVLRDLEVQGPNRSIAWVQRYHRLSGQTMNGIASHLQMALDVSVDGLVLRESNELYKQCLLLAEADRIRLAGDLNSRMLMAFGEVRDPRLRFLGSFDTRSNFPVLLYSLEKFLPRAFFTSGVRPAVSPEEALRQFLSPESDLRDTVILEDSRGARPTGPTGAGKVRIADYRNQYVRCEVEAEVPGRLVLLDSYYPGWRAFLDGNETEIRRADYAFRAVDVPAGKHKVEFSYRPRSFYAGGLITCLALAFAVSVGFRKSKKRPV